ncbi:MAG: single-strand DNA-binding protein [Parcubacteria group bacterium Gr01-1014_19]|nr:MAG: single-strand DNA-binding protein [Parcubacteria group bacterium Gr01-1014_19]
MNLNKVFILGRLTAAPVLRSTPGGQQVASFSLATNRNWTDKAGQKKEEVEFHNVVVWGRLAEIAGKFLTKGGLALVEGRMQTRSWQDKQGQTRKTTEIIADQIQLGPRSANSGGFAKPQMDADSAPMPEASGPSSAEPIPTIQIDEDIKAEDLPF